MCIKFVSLSENVHLRIVSEQFVILTPLKSKAHKLVLQIIVAGWGAHENYDPSHALNSEPLHDARPLRVILCSATLIVL